MLLTLNFILVSLPRAAQRELASPSLQASDDGTLARLQHGTKRESPEFPFFMLRKAKSIVERLWHRTVVSGGDIL